MPTPPESKTVLFSDIVGSSKLYQRLGNQKAEEQIRLVIQTLSSCTIKHSGVVIKTIGDEIMCAFNNLPDASDCASEMNALTQESKVELRTGISSGKLITRNGDLFGDVHFVAPYDEYRVCTVDQKFFPKVLKLHLFVLGCAWAWKIINHGCPECGAERVLPIEPIDFTWLRLAFNGHFCNKLNFF